ncbi:putative ribonuclease H-like domain-containing protein [Tanacetum coccineum]|uniref:Ribonuclease H-like domain-containing protein n=1 Tax=Tanacetum coccineum TaxID=301880 RepID=A0ABQ5CY39_9ASTR
MNYKPVVARNQSNSSAYTKACDNAGKARVETVPDKYYILLPLLTQDSPFSFSSKDSPDVGFKPSGEEEKKDAKVPEKESGVSSKEDDRDDQDLRDEFERLIHQEKDGNVNSTNNINTVNTASINNNVVDENIVYGCEDNPNMPNLEEIIYSDDEDVGAEADMTNLDTHIPVSPIPTTRIHKDHPVEQIIGDIHSAPQTRRMTKHVINHVEPKKAIQALTDPSWIEAMQDELLQFKLQNKKDERGIVVRNKARLVTQGYTQEYGTRKMREMDVKSAFLYGKIEEEVYVCQLLGFEDLEFPDIVYKVEKTLFGLHQAPRACQDKYMDEILKKFDFLTVKTASTPIETSKPLIKDDNAEDVDVHLYRSMIGSLMYLTSSRPDIMFADSPFDLEAYTDSDYAGASLDNKSTTGDCQFIGSRLILWQCKKQTVVANSTTEVGLMIGMSWEYYLDEIEVYTGNLRVSAAGMT